MPLMREFLESGRLGEVQPGLRPEQVIALLGEPEDRTPRKRPLQILRYGAVEFAFMPVPQTTDSRLVSTSIYFYDPHRPIPPALCPTDWLPTHATSGQQFRQFLEDSGMQVHSRVEGQQESLILSSGASVAFKDAGLHSIHFNRKDKKPQRKQMTVSLPEDAVDRLRRRAREEGVSVHDLIERMISAGA